MAEPVNTHRIDPYKNFKFRVRLDGHVVAGAETVTGLPTHGTSTAIKMPGLGKLNNITLKRVLTEDSGFANWLAGTHKGAVADAGRELTVEAVDENGTCSHSYALGRYRVGKCDLADGDSTASAFEHLELEPVE